MTIIPVPVIADLLFSIQKLGSKATIDDLVANYLNSHPPPDDSHVTTSLIINSIANDLGWTSFSNRLDFFSLVLFFFQDLKVKKRLL